MKVAPEFSSRTTILALLIYPHRIHLSDDHEPSISSEALIDANSLAFSPIPIIGIPAFTSHSTPDIVRFLHSLVNAH
jgi:hypothetical protein